ncbi:2Fe-2S ferredoxin [Parashewanella spongiae]|uniref:2Fe-2S ferredoxin n=1 Tax=Parashewanella spongiae TaxID=342950 RepID=A0A3A6TCV5_9GAMM|nr:class I ribonucleotide reductase maintenance protein YfaE [Parashewanella spongiae]MCL1079278.1 class I ribonucleotide reductase maintenance protein YfaE [Parashewanella spongiae]RJY10430.1 2Fe-2S ferredoxin [Parashewanella spongiae]
MRASLKILTCNKNVDVNGKSVIFSDDDNTLLSCLLKGGINVNNHCNEGFCGSCRANLIHGKVKYISKPLAFVHDSEILVCCSIPITNIKIEIVE